MGARVRKGMLAVAAVCALSACPGTPAETEDDDSGEATPPASSSDSAQTPDTTSTTAQTSTGMPSDTTSGTTMAMESSDDDPTVGPPSIDQGIIPDAPPLDDQCTMVDFLFVIDNSGSMSTSQANLIANFPNFISGIQATLEGVDSYHVGVVTTDDYFWNIPQCQNLSSLVVNTQSQSCGPYADGENYMTENDDLSTAFSCAADIGTSGSGLELPMQAVVEAVQGVDGGPGQCNEGYLREDSLLVIVIITDEYDGPGDPEGSSSPGDPMTWYDDVVNARGGIADNVVVLSLINYMGGPCPPSFGWDDGIHIMDFTNMFTNGFLGGICEPDYGPIFNDAIAVIDTACENFMPPQG